MSTFFSGDVSPPGYLMDQYSEHKIRSRAFWKTYNASPESTERWAISVLAYWNTPLVKSETESRR